MTPVVLGIGGYSGCGKTTLALELARELGGLVLSLDSYYRDLSHVEPAMRSLHNFDDPEMIEHSLAAEHLRALKEGSSIQLPKYDFATHTRLTAAKPVVGERRAVVVEGNFALHYPELRALYDVCIYVAAPEAVCYERRFRRDTRERGRSPDSVIKQYAASVEPMAELYVKPSAVYADVTVDGTASLDWSVEQVRAALDERGLIPT
jgi:uridine kinase